MDLVPVDSTAFRNAIEALKDFLPQATLNVTDTGLNIRGMDVSHVGFMDYTLAADDCARLELRGGPLRIGITTAILARALAAVSGGDSVTLSVDARKETLKVSYSNEKLSKKAVYNIPTLDIDEDVMDLPDLTYNASVTCKTTDVANVIKEVAHFGDAIRLQLDEGGFHISTKGDMGAVTQTLENTDDRDMTLGEDNVAAMFGMKYLAAIMKGGVTLAITVQLDFDPAQPLRAAFKFGSGSHFTAYLAPKVENE
jgi:proliferating cell nuclear antigen PCNA